MKEVITVVDSAAPNAYLYGTLTMILLDKNENQYGPAPVVRETLRQAKLEDLALYSRAYLTGAKSSLSARLALALGVPEERVLLGYGSEDLLKQAVHCYLRPGGAMLVPSLSWWYYGSIAAEVSAQTVPYPLRDLGDRFAYAADEIVRLYDSHHPDVILIASPNNPTGNSIDGGTLRAVADHCRSSVIILDETYHGFAPRRLDSPSDLLRRWDRMVILRTFSKYYALAGLRIGYALAGEGLTRLITYSARYLGFNRISESLALLALDAEDYYRDVALHMEVDKAEYYRVFSSHGGFTPYLSDANFIFVRFPPGMKETLMERFSRRGVTLKFFKEPPLENYLRITIGTREQNAVVMDAARSLPGFAPTPLPADGP